MLDDLPFLDRVDLDLTRRLRVAGLGGEEHPALVQRAGDKLLPLGAFLHEEDVQLASLAPCREQLHPRLFAARAVEAGAPERERAVVLPVRAEAHGLQEGPQLHPARRDEGRRGVLLGPGVVDVDVDPDVAGLDVAPEPRAALAGVERELDTVDLQLRKIRRERAHEALQEDRRFELALEETAPLRSLVVRPDREYEVACAGVGPVAVHVDLAPQVRRRLRPGRAVVIDAERDVMEREADGVEQELVRLRAQVKDGVVSALAFVPGDPDDAGLERDLACLAQSERLPLTDDDLGGEIKLAGRRLHGDLRVLDREVRHTVGPYTPRERFARAPDGAPLLALDVERDLGVGLGLPDGPCLEDERALVEEDLAAEIQPRRPPVGVPGSLDVQRQLERFDPRRVRPRVDPWECHLVPSDLASQHRDGAAVLVERHHEGGHLASRAEVPEP